MCTYIIQIHSIHTRHSDNLHLPQTGLTLVQKGVAYSGCKIYNHLPLHIKNISNNVPLFKSILKKLLLQYVFYTSKILMIVFTKK